MNSILLHRPPSSAIVWSVFGFRVCLSVVVVGISLVTSCGIVVVRSLCLYVVLLLVSLVGFH